MSAVPTSPLLPGDSGYTTIYDLWVAQGSAQFVEDQASGWLRRAIWPDATATQPTFTLVCSAAGSTSEDLDTGPEGGYGHSMVTHQRSWQPRGSLPREAV